MEENVEEKIRSITEQANQTRKMLLEEYLGHSIVYGGGYKYGNTGRSSGSSRRFVI